MATASRTSEHKKYVRKEITEEDVRAKAFHIYRNRQENGIHGDAFSDWIQAERELELKL